jgi:hypothetical protein
VLSSWRGSLGLNGSLQDRVTIDVTEFEQLVTAKAPSGSPRLKNIRYYGREDRTDWVIADQLTTQGQGAGKTETYIPVKIAAERPYAPKLHAPAKAGPEFTIVDYLHSLQLTHSQVRFSSGWWDREPARSLLWALAGVLIVAGAGPTLRNILNGGAVQTSSTTAVTPKQSDKDLAHVRELDAELERKLTETEAPAKKLTAGPLEAPAAVEKPKPVKEFDGEFYPTETHVKREKP